MLNKDTIFRLFVALVAGICGYLFFGAWYPWHFAVREQAQLLMLTPGTILSYMQEPAWLACYLGDYLTQFFFHPRLGIGLLVVVLLLTWWVGARLLRRVVDYAHIELYALFPLAAEMVMLGRIDYPLSMPFVLLLSLLFAGICLRIRQPEVSVVVGILVLPLVYGLAGYGVYLFLLTVIAVELARGELRLSYWQVLAAEAVVVPLSLGDYFQLEGREVFCYPAVERVWLFPALTWLVVIVMLTLVPRRRFYMNWREQAAVWSLSFLLLVGGLAITTDFHREKMLAIGAAYDRGEWEDLLPQPCFVSRWTTTRAVVRLSATLWRASVASADGYLGLSRYLCAVRSLFCPWRLEYGAIYGTSGDGGLSEIAKHSWGEAAGGDLSGGERQFGDAQISHNIGADMVLCGLGEEARGKAGYDRSGGCPSRFTRPLGCTGDALLFGRIATQAARGYRLRSLLLFAGA